MTILNSEPVTTENKSGAAEAPKQGWLHNLWAEIKGLFWLLLAVLGFHSFIAKPFYIPSISMMPTLLVGDRLFVSKFAYGWSFVSPTIPNPVALFQWLVLREEVDSLAFTLPESKGRVWGATPEGAQRVARRLKAGQVEVNGGAFNPAAPFGGYKQSGLGREAGKFGLEEFCEVKAMQL